MRTDLRLDILRLVRKSGQATRQDLARQLDISISLATKTAAELISRGLLNETGKTGASSSGRPADFLALVPEAAYAVGLHLGNTRQMAVLTDLTGEVLARLAEPVFVTDDRERILHDLQALVRRTIQAAGIDEARLAGVGVGLSDIVDPVSGVSYGWPDTPGWSAAWADFEVREALASVLSYAHICVDDIVRSLGIAEARYGQGRDQSHFIYILIDEGIGMAVMTGGLPYIGQSHIAGEIAHIPIPSATELCDCGNVGCLRTMTGIPIVLKRVQERLEATPIRSELRQANGTVDIQAVFAAAGRGDKLAVQVLTETGESLGKALAIVVNLLGPHSIILGGALSKSTHFVEAAGRTMRMNALALAARQVILLPSQLDEYSGARGAATQVLEALFQPDSANLLSRR